MELIGVTGVVKAGVASVGSYVMAINIGFVSEIVGCIVFSSLPKVEDANVVTLSSMG